MSGSTLKLSKTKTAIRNVAPLLGQHTEEILNNLLGLSKQEIKKLFDRGGI